MYIAKTTLDERNTIECALADAFCDIDTAHLLIMDEINEHFMSIKQKAIDAWEAERMGRRLRAAANMIFDSLLRYHLTLGHYNGRGVDVHLEGAARAQRAISATKADELYWKARAGLDSEAARKMDEAREKIDRLPDEEAAPLLEALVAGGGAG